MGHDCAEDVQVLPSQPADVLSLILKLRYLHVKCVNHVVQQRIIGTALSSGARSKRRMFVEGTLKTTPSA